LFSGIVEAVGRVHRSALNAAGMRLTVEAPFEGLALGESVCVSGVCLTVVATSPPTFDVDVSAETLRRSNRARFESGGEVNLERSLRLGERLGGHLVFGHVDGIGTLRAVTPEGDSKLLRFAAPEAVSRYLVEKGSVAVDGVSLTVFACEGGEFSTAVIPHTARVTTLGKLRTGDLVNLESDMIARYVERLATPYRG
jgi:riboflavin synthase